MHMRTAINPLHTGRDIRRREKIELGNMGTVICEKPVLRLGEKYSLERTSSYSTSKEEEASVLFI